MEKFLEVKNLRVSYHSYAGEVQSVRGVSFSIYAGQSVAIVGESGCGKSVTAKTIMGLIQTPPDQGGKSDPVRGKGHPFPDAGAVAGIQGKGLRHHLPGCAGGLKPHHDHRKPGG